jgi:arylformamidase
MRFIDLSQPVYDACPNCPAHPVPRSVITDDHPAVGWRVEVLTIASHTGSHVDAPLHKIAGGASLDDLPLERFAGPAHVVDLRDSEPDRAIDGATLLTKLGRTELNDCYVLLATGWGSRRAMTEEWTSRSPRLDPSGARFLVERGIRGVGIDHFSIGGSHPENTEVHEILLSASVVIVEDLFCPDELFALPMPVELMALPINLRNHSGAWCRPVVVVR